MPIEVEPRLDGVAETLLWTLRNRAEESKHPGSCFTDPWSVRLYETISYDYGRFGKPGQLHALRARALDRAARAYLDTHPAATVVALGEGLQTTYWRLGRPRVPWLSVDLAPVQELRTRLLPEEPWVTPLAASALDRSWMDRVDPAHGVFISAEGLLMYFDRADALSLIADCAARFPGGQLFFDSIPAWLSARTGRGLRFSDRYTAPPMPFSLSVTEAARLVELIPRVVAATEIALPPGRGVWASRTVRILAARPPLRDRRPSLTLLDFAGRTGAHHA
ncbi:O-methyltransferase involved in polyketide biosynthesis [Asanoa ferruginea]|uniref:O-methyltransferase involved in polyketide biosynthesis n=1 Tax=Asanoa ferruginea TaxID=53367 RepID=A0A3D9ZQ31_9ACTN|nr:class I SAM-dependent methyltransferase [Asanoa ferruginea]REF98744.1 O-methyltransferase involved in polyketide biosynthesis [Asanoa ferruginea]GIF49485.1 O-methyltransferase [Asanoa ferruginea]